MAQARVPTLLYNSNHAHPVVRLAAQVTLPSDGLIPDSVTARLLFSGVEQTKSKWLGTNWAAGSTRRIVLSFDALAKATGLYAYTLEVTRWYQGGPQPQTVPGELVIVNRENSPFGAGWWLAGFEQLVHLSSTHKLWIGGDGSARVFDSVGVNLWRAPNVDRPEQLEFDGTYYCRRLPHRGGVLFDAAGRHVLSKNRLADSHAWAHRTWFDYDGSNRLSAIRLPVTGGFKTYTFAYDGAGRLDSVIAPPAGATARITQVAVTSGRLLTIRDPDITTVTFGYDGAFTNRVISRTDRRGTVTTYAFGGANTLSQATISLDAGATIVTTFAPQEIKGLAGSAAIAPASALTKLDGPRTDVGDTTLLWLNRFGAPTKVRDAVGNETVLARADVNFPAAVTEVRYPNSRILRATYDARGNILTSRDVDVYTPGQDAVTTYAWDATWDFVTSVTAPTGEITQFGYNAATGNREWQRPGTDPARNVTFAYGDLLLLRASQLPGTPVSRDSIQYDSLGNVRLTRTPLGATSYAFKDAVGRDTLVQTPLDVPGNKHVLQRIRYDISGQDTLNIALSDSSIGRIDSTIVRTHYDAEGNADSALTRSGPDVNAIGWVRRAFAYDRANRQTWDSLVGSYAIPMRYDPAGNLTNGGRRGGDGVAVFYDALNRPIVRQGSDIARFTYDAMGNLMTANNPYARIARAYFKNGTLRADTLRLSTVEIADSNFALHIYGQAYRYDLSGRRVWSKSPAQFQTADTVTYAYDPVLGALATMRDPFGNLYRCVYDLVGRPIRLTRLAQLPDSVYEVSTYDLDSRLARRVVSRGPSATLVRRDSIVYDGRSKALRNAFGADAVTFTPLGAVSVSFVGGQQETFGVDALGNRSSVQSAGRPLALSRYQAGSGRLLREWTVEDIPDSTLYSYEWDGATGQVDRYDYWSPPWSQVRDWEQRTTLNTYNAERQLVRTMFYLDSAWNTSPPPLGYHAYTSDETYRYDALGRRVYARVVRGPNCQNKDQSSGCRSTITRTIWDGDQIVAEVRIPGDSSLGAMLEQDTPEGTPHQGIVRYLHAGGIDQPLALWKDQLFELYADWRGAFVQATCPSAPCDGDAIYLPATVSSVYGAPPAYPFGPPSWHGSLVEGGQDASGLQYRRNRYYDPKTGRFTQEDPIGLAGGLNLYGFAGGDPVNFSDPFGLCKDKNGNEVHGLQCDMNEHQGLADPGLLDPTAWIAGGLAGGLRVGLARLFGRSATTAAAGALATSSAAAGADALAIQVAEATGGTVTQLAKSQGLRVTIQGARNVVVRIKESGAFRVSIEGIGSLTREGVVSGSKALTHLTARSADEIIALTRKALEWVATPR
jgi:RHS repeat-associated protein